MPKKSAKLIKTDTTRAIEAVAKHGPHKPPLFSESGFQGRYAFPEKPTLQREMGMGSHALRSSFPRRRERRESTRSHAGESFATPSERGNELLGVCDSL
ncbi:hypothetical protein [Endozoicomonas sp. 8E]|uniref:hypothetical protein n=1 Tax=Endozoicomonas sp. 8E TaxID=3035692 RepID=UPI0029390A1E|nr:hypothetical protein [Endozoicomonas sp. 8E]WOG29637.1 hypothetical protein P6910_08280 [Endozoicomonas sp. 8E]